MVSAEERAARATQAEDIERKLRDVVDQTDGKLIAITDVYIEPISSNEISDRQNAYRSASSSRRRSPVPPCVAAWPRMPVVL